MKILLDLPAQTITVTGPGPIVPGLEATAEPHGLSIDSTENEFHDGGKIIAVDSMVPLEPCLSHGIQASDPRRYIAPGERWVFLEPGAVEDLMPPDDATIAALLPIIGKRIRLDIVDRRPKLAKVLAMFGDSYAPKVSPTGDHDLGWLMRYWSYRAGGRPLQGEFELTATHGSDGWCNYHYHELLFVALNFLKNRRISDWWLGLRMAFAQSQWGMVYRGRHAGMFKGEKGEEFFGQGFAPDWGKQYFLGLVIWWFLSKKHPVIDKAVQAHLARLRVAPFMWPGEWGERIPARYLESLELAFILTGEPIFKTHADAAIRNIWAQRNANGLWVNKGSPDTTSPWMHAKLINNLLRWEALGVKHGDAKAVAALTMRLGTTTKHGKPAVLYRFTGPEANVQSPSLAAFMLPMLRKVSGGEPWEEFCYGEYLGASWARVAAGNPLPVSEVSMDVPEQGLAGWPKSCRELLCGIIE